MAGRHVGRPVLARRGIGTRLLADIARMARRQGAEEIVLTAPADSQAVLPMVLSAGLRGRIRMAGDTVTVRIALTSCGSDAVTTS